MKNTKMNNKGFSLVELIVVVLIMAILAVALAPQVMKWVDNSKKATDVQNYDGLIANAQLALTDSNAYSAVKSLPFKINMTSSGTTTDLPDGAAKTAFEGAMTTLDSGWSAVKPKVSGASYEIVVSGGAVTRSTETSKVPSDSMD